MFPLSVGHPWRKIQVCEFVLRAFPWGVRENADQQMFSVKAQAVSIFSFVTQTVSVSTTQFCLCSVKAARDNMKVNGVAVSQ